MSDNICPFIGVEEDRYTAVGFPSLRNMCHRNDTPAPVDTIYQGKYCMSAEHATCPVFLRQANAAVPPPAEAVKAAPAAYPKQSRRSHLEPRVTAPIPIKAPKRRSRDVILPIMAVVGAVGIFLAVLLILPPASAFQGALPVTMTNTPQPLLPSLTSTGGNLVSIIQASFTPTSRFSPTPPSTATGKPTLTSTKRTPTNTTAPIASLPTQCVHPAGWVVYIVRAGDTMSNLSRIFNISIAQLQLANCMGSSVALYVGQAIYTPWIPPTQFIPTQVIPTQITPSPVTPSATVPTNTLEPTTAVPTTAVPPTEVTPPTAEPTSEVPTQETTEAIIGATPVPPSESPPPPPGEGD